MGEATDRHARNEAYLFFAAALGLLYILVAMPMNVLSSNSTPLESMPTILRDVMMFSPSTHFVLFAQSILFRGAGLSVVWPEFLFIAGSGRSFPSLLWSGSDRWRFRRDDPLGERLAMRGGNERRRADQGARIGALAWRVTTSLGSNAGAER